METQQSEDDGFVAFLPRAESTGTTNTLVCAPHFVAYCSVARAESPSHIRIDQKGLIRAFINLACQINVFG